MRRIVSRTTMSFNIYQQQYTTWQQWRSPLLKFWCCSGNSDSGSSFQHCWGDNIQPMASGRTATKAIDAGVYCFVSPATAVWCWFFSWMARSGNLDVTVLCHPRSLKFFCHQWIFIFILNLYYVAKASTMLAVAAFSPRSFSGNVEYCPPLDCKCCFLIWLCHWV